MLNKLAVELAFLLPFVPGDELGLVTAQAIDHWPRWAKQVKRHHN